MPITLRSLSIPLCLLTLAACSDDADQFPPAIPLTVVPAAAPEGAPGEMRSLGLRVTLTEPASRDVSVSFSTSDGSATAGEDYLATSGDLRIPAGALQGLIEIEMLGDADEEAAETINVTVAADGPVSVTATEVTATIANDDSSCDVPFSKDPNPWLVGDELPLNFAHRGGKFDFPENTLFAFTEAARAGADVLEMDVYQTADNELVVLHDLDVDRTTNGSGDVVDLTLAEIQALDAAYWFVPGDGTQEDRPESDYTYRGIATGDKPPPAGYSAEDFRIPTLEEVLARFPHELLNLELKPDQDAAGNYEAQMAAMLQRYGRSTDIIAGSFRDAATANFKAVAPCVYSYIPLGEGLELYGIFTSTGEVPPVPDHIAAQTPLTLDQVGPEIPGDDPVPIVTQEFVNAAHEANLAVQVWTINTCEEMLRMIDFGVDAIMTDRPLLLEDLLNTPAAERSCD